MEFFIERLERLFVAGDLAGAVQLIGSYEATDPVRHAVGMAALAAHQSDVAGATQHAARAFALRPYEPLVLQYMAIAALMRGDRKAAEDHARDAVGRGGGVRSLGWLGNVQLGNGDFAAAEATYRRMLELEPTSVQALNGLGACRYKQQDLDAAVGWFARALDADPTDPGPIRSLMHMYSDAGRVLGALALANLTRDRHKDDASVLALDLMVLHLNHVLMGGYPPPGTVADADEAVAAVLRDSARSPARARLGVARALIDCQRLDDARRILGKLEDQLTSAADRGNAEYIRGLLAEHDNEPDRALAAFEAAVTADVHRWDACCNALTLLMDRNDDAAIARAGQLLAKIPPEVKGASPQLLFNEAIYLRRIGNRTAALSNLQRVLTATKNEGELAALARQLLEEMSHG